MITRIRAKNYRSLKSVDQPLGRFHALIGANGTGKSTFLDVVSFVGDVLRRGPLDAAIGNGPGHPQRAADPQHLSWMRLNHKIQLALDVTVPRGTSATYELGIDVSQNVKINEEELMVQGRQVVSKGNGESEVYFDEDASTGWTTVFRLGASKSALGNLPEDESRFPVATWVKRFLISGVARVSLNADALRRPAPPGGTDPFLPDGSNLPWVIEALATREPARFEAWVAHLRTAIPDLKTVTTIERPEDRHRYVVVEYDTGLKVPSWGVSDGTLRLMALTLLGFVVTDGTYLIEEPENGIHPRAIEAVYRAISNVRGGQVLCASHSPIVLSLAKPAEILCFEKNSDGSTKITSGDKHPLLADWKGEVDLGTLFAAGVLG